MQLHEYTESLRYSLKQSQDALERQLAKPSASLRATNIPLDEEHLKTVLMQHRQTLEHLTTTMRSDMKDLRLIQGRVQDKVAVRR